MTIAEIVCALLDKLGALLKLHVWLFLLAAPPAMDAETVLLSSLELPGAHPPIAVQLFQLNAHPITTIVETVFAIPDTLGALLLSNVFAFLLAVKLMTTAETA